MSISGIFKKPDFGLLAMRLVLGTCFIVHGSLKFMGGSKVLEQVGQSLQVIGVSNLPVFFGGIAALIEILGGASVFFGYKFRLGVSAILIVLIVAFYSTFMATPDFMKYAWPLEMLAVFFGLLFIGPGKHSVDKG